MGATANFPLSIAPWLQNFCEAKNQRIDNGWSNTSMLRLETKENGTMENRPQCEQCPFSNVHCSMAPKFLPGKNFSGGGI
jgi:hypothetical protein